MTKSEMITRCRKDFPALKRTFQGQPLAYLDGPAGTQVPRMVIDAVADYYQRANANTHGEFITSQETDNLLEQCRTNLAAFLGAPSSREISFGANMTTLTFSVANAFARQLKAGDEILVTQLDHEANRGPWLALREYGVKVQEITITHEGKLNYQDFEEKISERTRLVALGYASNALGTVNDIARARQLTGRFGALLYVDAVHYAPHFPINVQKDGMDFLVCSAYKFYGPHVGILYCRDGLMDRLPTDRLRTQDPNAPYRIETGTLNHASIAGVSATIEYIAKFGSGNHLQHRLETALLNISQYEHELALYLYHQLTGIKGITIRGPSFDEPLRTPTISFTLDGYTANDICRYLAQAGICAWDGHFYAIRPIEVLELLEKGGVTRIGISMYNTHEEIDRLLNRLDMLSSRK